MREVRQADVIADDTARRQFLSHGGGDAAETEYADSVA
jgi:hypothetical protein